MAIWYWDPVGGNNANDGTTFANRKLTLQSLTTVAAGDEVRCMASPDPVSTAINATWTDGSNTVTLASAVTQVIASCDTNWTASTNVTCSTNTARKEGTACQNTSIAAGFSTGKAAYFATGTLDCSGYQQLTFWMKQTSGTLAVAGDYTLRLCSDTAGATTVNTFDIPPVAVLNTWFPVTVDLATNLGASIQSIALYVGVDRGAVVLQFDNINVALASSDPAAITVNSLISKNTGTEAWFGIRSIVGTTVILDSSPAYTINLAGTEPLYSGTTETVTLYRRETSKTAMATGLSTQVNYYAGATGTLGNVVTISGGWNTTDMTTQTGQTYLDGSNGYGYGLGYTNASSTSYTSISAFGCVRYSNGVYIALSTSGINNTMSFIDLNCNDTGFLAGTNLYSCSVTVINAVKNGSTTSTYGSGCVGQTKRSTINFTNVNSNWGSGFFFGTANGGQASFTNTITINNAKRNSYSGFFTVSAVSNTINLGDMEYNSPAAYFGQVQLENATVYTPGSAYTSTISTHDNTVTINNMSTSSSSSPGIIFGDSSNNNKVTITGVFTGFLSSNGMCIRAIRAGTNYITSPTAVWGNSTYTLYTDGVSTLYVNTADETIKTMSQAVGSVSIIKNAYGVFNQTYVSSGTSWGLS